MVNNMRDIHSHIMYGIDDGASTKEESLSILKKAYDDGITDIVLTPHYINKSKYNCNNKKKQKILNELKKELKKDNIDINLYLGNEVMIDRDIIKLIKKDEVATINKSKYILVEFPMNSEEKDSINIMFELIRKGYLPILAHPERYSYVRKHPEKIDKYIEMGVLLQGNYLSLFGKYGKEAKKFLKKLLKQRKITILASDIHKGKNKYRIKRLKRKLMWLIRDKDYIEKILDTNFIKIIKNKEL